MTGARVKAKKAQPKKKTRSNGSGELKFTVPADIDRLQDYVKEGLLTPNRLEDDKSSYAPLDFTSISSRDVGKQHSNWAVRHAHIIFLIGNLRAEIGNSKHDLKNAEADWLIKHGTNHKTKYAAEAAMRKSKRITRLRDRLRAAEASLTRYEALAESYRVLREAASREIARRQDERASRD
jgi:hypothetical protein